jgi:AcrR family transcriptional regulator
VPSKRVRPAATPVEALRDRVLEASVDLIEQGGLEALSLREVARRAGVSHQAPYHYFADREAILAAICERGFATLAQKVAEAYRSGDKATERIERATIAYVRFAVDHPAHFRVMFRPELVHHEAHSNVSDAAAEAFGLVPAMIRDAMAEGLPVEPNLEAVTAMIWSFAHGYACLLLDGPLAKMSPTVAVNRDRAIREAARSFGVLLEAAVERGRSENAAPPKRAEGRR